MTINVYPQTPATVVVEGPGSGVSPATVDAKIAEQAATDAATYSPIGSVAGTAVSGTAASGTALVGTGSGTAEWSATKTVDTTNAPLGPSTSPTPGTGASGVSASDHVHPLPTSAQLVTQLQNGGIGLITPLWEVITSGEITLPRGHTDDSGSYGSTPASGTVHYTYFVAQQTGTRTTIRFTAGGTAQASQTYTNVGLYSVNPTTGVLTLMAVATAKALSGAYGQNTYTLTSGQLLDSGILYAIGFLQVAATAGSLGGAWFNAAYLNGNPGLAKVGATGVTTLPTGTVAAPTNTSNFPVYYEIA